MSVWVSTFVVWQSFDRFSYFWTDRFSSIDPGRLSPDNYNILSYNSHRHLFLVINFYALSYTHRMRSRFSLPHYLFLALFVIFAACKCLFFRIQKSTIIYSLLIFFPLHLLSNNVNVTLHFMRFNCFFSFFLYLDYILVVCVCDICLFDLVGCVVLFVPHEKRITKGDNLKNSLISIFLAKEMF